MKKLVTFASLVASVIMVFSLSVPGAIAATNADLAYPYYTPFPW